MIYRCLFHRSHVTACQRVIWVFNLEDDDLIGHLQEMNLCLGKG